MKSKLGVDIGLRVPVPEAEQTLPWFGASHHAGSGFAFMTRCTAATYRSHVF
jgi:hypothetical protein